MGASHPNYRLNQEKLAALDSQGRFDTITLHFDSSSTTLYNCNQNQLKKFKPIYFIIFQKRKYIITDSQRSRISYFEANITSTNSTKYNPHYMKLRYSQDPLAFDIAMKIIYGFTNVPIPQEKLIHVFLITEELRIKRCEEYNLYFRDELFEMSARYLELKKEIPPDVSIPLLIYAIHKRNEKLITLCHKKADLKKLLDLMIRNGAFKDLGIIQGMYLLYQYKKRCGDFTLSEEEKISEEVRKFSTYQNYYLKNLIIDTNLYKYSDRIYDNDLTNHITKSIEIQRMKSMKIAHKFPHSHSNKVDNALFIKEKKYLITWSPEKKEPIILRNLATGNAPPIKRFENCLVSNAIALKNGSLASVSFDDPCPEIQLYSIHTGLIQRHKRVMFNPYPRTQQQQYQNFYYFPNFPIEIRDSILLASDLEGKIYKFDLKEEDPWKTLKIVVIQAKVGTDNPTSFCNPAILSETQILTGIDNDINLYEFDSAAVDNFKKIRIFQHNERVYSIFKLNENLIATGSIDKKIMLWAPRCPLEKDPLLRIFNDYGSLRYTIDCHLIFDKFLVKFVASYIQVWNLENSSDVPISTISIRLNSKTSALRFSQSSIIVCQHSNYGILKW